MCIPVPTPLQERMRSVGTSTRLIKGGSEETHTSPRCVFSRRPLTIRADASLSFVTSLQLIIGVLMALAALIISLIRGTPRVTFMDATPAKWNVFNVICVPGSPIDCAPTAPTVDPEANRVSAAGNYLGAGRKVPGSIFALTNFDRQASKNDRNCSSVTLVVLSTPTMDVSDPAQSGGIDSKRNLPWLSSSRLRCAPRSSPSGRPRCPRTTARGIIMRCSTNARIVVR